MLRAHPVIDFDWLTKLHQNKRLALATCDGGYVHLDDNPQAFVSELIRLAHIGAKVEAKAAETVRRLDA